MLLPSLTLARMLARMPDGNSRFRTAGVIACEKLEHTGPAPKAATEPSASKLSIKIRTLGSCRSWPAGSSRSSKHRAHGAPRRRAA